MAKLILIRHGTSEWNEKGLWTGWTDIALAPKGIQEAKAAGESIRDIHIDIAFTSALQRAQQTLHYVLDVKNQLDIPIFSSASLNEKSYGDLTGKNKWEVKAQYGEEQFKLWRRAWNAPIPNGETLKTVYERVIPYYLEHILPALISGKNVLIAAHGNSLRTLIKYLDNINDQDIENFEVGLGEVYVYDIDSNGEILNREVRNEVAQKGTV